MKNEVICCGVLERMNIQWMRKINGTVCFPYIIGYSDINMYRISYCPSCGKRIADVIVEPKQLKQTL
jgi:hypothetical protein